MGFFTDLLLKEQQSPLGSQCLFTLTTYIIHSACRKNT